MLSTTSGATRKLVITGSQETAVDTATSRSSGNDQLCGHSCSQRTVTQLRGCAGQCGCLAAASTEGSCCRVSRLRTTCMALMKAAAQRHLPADVRLRSSPLCRCGMQLPNKRKHGPPATSNGAFSSCPMHDLNTSCECCTTVYQELSEGVSSMVPQ